MMAHFTLLADRPTDAFLGQLQQAGIDFREWLQPAYLFRKRKTSTHTIKLTPGWIQPRDIDAGYLRLSAADPDAAHTLAVQLGEQHGIHIANGGRIME